MNNVMKLTAFLYYSTLRHRENVLIFSPKLKSNLTNRRKKCMYNKANNDGGKKGEKSMSCENFST